MKLLLPCVLFCLPSCSTVSNLRDIAADAKPIIAKVKAAKTDADVDKNGKVTADEWLEWLTVGGGAVLLADLVALFERIDGAPSP